MADIIEEHWRHRRFTLGMTKDEILALLRDLHIHHKTFWKKFGVNTAALDRSGEILYYSIDITTAIKCCIEKRDETTGEWD